MKTTIMFKLSPNARNVSTTLRGAVCIAPHHLLKRFGPPSRASADNKVSGTYVFEDNQRSTLMMYDWKATALYDGHPKANLPTVQAFWSSEEPAEFSVAGHRFVDLFEFAKWIGAISLRLEGGYQWTHI